MTSEEMRLYGYYSQCEIDRKKQIEDYIRNEVNTPNNRSIGLDLNTLGELHFSQGVAWADSQARRDIDRVISADRAEITDAFCKVCSDGRKKDYPHGECPRSSCAKFNRFIRLCSKSSTPKFENPLITEIYNAKTWQD